MKWATRVSKDSEQNPEVNESLLFQRTLSNNVHPLLLPQHVSASECTAVVLHLNKGHFGRSLGQRFILDFTDTKQTAVSLMYK